ncbi:hypothetical protein EDB83DRAFT_2523729 [Lactarius deliciosus]|nr:hypothetical protein EDB83DRAFT_2523729 [Lactarius deliciosus]
MLTVRALFLIDILGCRGSGARQSCAVWGSARTYAIAAVFQIPVEEVSSQLQRAHPFDIWPVPLTQIHLTSDFKAVDEYLSHYQSSDVFIEVDAGASSEVSTSLFLPRVKLHSTEFAHLQALNAPEIRGDPWNPAPHLLHTAERGNDTIVCPERLFNCDHPLLQIVTNVVDYIRQALELCPPCLPSMMLKIAQCVYGDLNGVMMDIGHSSLASFHRTQLPVRYYRVNISHAQELPNEADPRSAGFCHDVRDCGAKFQTLVEERGDVHGSKYPRQA